MADGGCRRKIESIWSQQLGYGPSFRSILCAQIDIKLDVPVEEETRPTPRIRKCPLVEHSLVIKAKAISVTHAAQHNVDRETRWLGGAGGVK